MSMWLGIQQYTIFYILLNHDAFQVTFKFGDVLKTYDQKILKPRGSLKI